jgi:hypothetical protein
MKEFSHPKESIFKRKTRSVNRKEDRDYFEIKMQTFPACKSIFKVQKPLSKKFNALYTMHNKDTSESFSLPKPTGTPNIMKVELFRNF